MFILIPSALNETWEKITHLKPTENKGGNSRKKYRYAVTGAVSRVTTPEQFKAALNQCRSQSEDFPLVFPLVFRFPSCLRSPLCVLSRCPVVPRLLPSRFALSPRSSSSALTYTSLSLPVCWMCHLFSTSLHLPSTVTNEEFLTLLSQHGLGRSKEDCSPLNTRMQLVKAILNAHWRKQFTITRTEELRVVHLDIFTK